MNARRGWGVALVALFFLGIVALGGYALAQMGPGMMGPGGMMGGGMMGAVATNDRPWITVMLDRREDLGLSAEQVGRLFMLRDRFTKEVQKKSEALEKIERELDQLIGPGAVDLKAVDAKLKEAEAIRTDLRLSRFKVIEEGKAVLTPEQRKKLVELAKEQQPSSLGPAKERPMMGSGGSGMEEMQRFMQSDRGPQAMAAMMQMARQMGNGDVMLGMVRMMEMMGNMGGMMGPGGQQ
ncbi:MAG: periplasmic heavy metal sensor [candidate division NC10 bacterium]|nr:periplasmic heavy metal sensor [candidate division NC10 bacterium]